MPSLSQLRCCMAIWVRVLFVGTFGLVAPARAQNTIWFCVDHSASGLGTGHGYIELWPGNDNTKAVARGFYSLQKPLCFGGGLSFARVKDDLGAPWEYSLKFDVTDAEYFAVVRRINFTVNGSFQYSLLTFSEQEQTMNCVGWLEYLAKAIYQNGATSTTLPRTTNRAGIRDPSGFWKSLNALGAGGTWTTLGSGGRFLTGTVVKNPNRAVEALPAGMRSVEDLQPADSIDYACFDMGDSLAQYEAHTTPSLLASHMEILSIDSSLGSFSVNLTDSFVVQIAGVDASRNILSVDWGDGSPYSEGQSRMAHEYSSTGQFFGSVAEVDSGAVRRYPISVAVASTGPTDTARVAVSPLPAGTANNPCADAESSLVLAVDMGGVVGGLRVRVDENPTRNSNIRVRYALAGHRGGRIDLIDITGRRIVQSVLPDWGSGWHVFTLSPSPAPRPGVYFVRVSEGAASRVARVAVLE